MPLLLLPLVVVGAVVAAALGVPARTVARWAGTAVAGLLGLTVLMLLGFVILDGVDPEDADDDRGEVAEPSSGTRVVDAVLLPVGDPEAFDVPPVPLAGLEAGDVVLLEAALDGDGEVRQCSTTAAGERRCGLATPVPEPASGTARFLVPVEQCGGGACRFELTVGDGPPVAALPIVLGPAPPRPTVEVAPGPYAHGATVVVGLAGFEPGRVVVLTQCTPPGPVDPRSCGAPAPELEVPVDDDGSALVVYPAHIGPVGEAGAECRRGRACAVAVLDEPGTLADLTLAGSAAAVVPPVRQAVGLGAGVLFVLLAAVLLARTSWTPPEGDPLAGIDIGVPEDWLDLRREL